MSERREPDPQAKAEDPTDYNQRRRLEAIADARRNALHTHESLPLKGGMPGDPAAEISMFTAAQAYVLELEQLIREHGGTEYYDTVLGEFSIPHPETYDFKMEEQTKYGANVVEDTYPHDELEGKEYPKPKNRLPKNKRKKVVGIVSRLGSESVAFSDLPPTPSSEWQFEVYKGQYKSGIATGVSESPVPWDISIDAIKLANKFVREIGLDTEIDDSKSEWEL